MRVSAGFQPKDHRFNWRGLQKEILSNFPRDNGKRKTEKKS
jgi:hypothetical protein